MVGYGIAQRWVAPVECRRGAEGASLAPMIADNPTPPAPKTATVEPGSTLARLMTAPIPVMTAQPTSAATSRSVPAGRGTHERSSTTAWRAKVDR
jgi:hypothetical protein